MLALHIAGELHERVGRAPSNFAVTLPAGDGDLLAELATDPRRLDFLALDPAAGEREMEAALVGRITEFLTHLGRGFVYVGRQFRLTVGDSGVLLVPGKDDVVVVEYALASIASPIAVAAYTAQELPAGVREVLSAAAEIAHAIHDLPVTPERGGRVPRPST